MSLIDLKRLREIDILVAEKVMGWRREGENLFPPGKEKWRTRDGLPITPEYSRDIAAAMEIFERFLGLLVRAPSRWECTLANLGSSKPSSDNNFYAEAETAPLAICLAALRACGVKLPEN